MKEHIILWTDKGHTRKKVPYDSICGCHYWSPERYDSSLEYLVLINPILSATGRGKEFTASISISHRSLTYIGTMSEKGPDKRWVYHRDRRLGLTTLYADIKSAMEYNIHMYASASKQIPEWMLNDSIEIFHSARREFFRIFRPDENLDNT